MVFVGAHGVERLSLDVATEVASGDFFGLVRLTPTAVETVDRLRTVMVRPEHLHSRLSGPVGMMREGGIDVGGVDVSSDRAAIDEPADIAWFVLGTKADTLVQLSRLRRDLPPREVHAVRRHEVGPIVRARAYPEHDSYPAVPSSPPTSSRLGGRCSTVATCWRVPAGFCSVCCRSAASSL